MQGFGIAGNLASTASDIRISASGEVRLTDAKLTARGAVTAEAASIAIASPARQSEVTSATSGITLRATKGVSVKGAKISGVERDFQSFASLGGVTIASGGEALELIEDGAFDTMIASSREGIAVQAGATLTTNRAGLSSAQDSTMSAADSMTLVTSAFSASRDIRLLGAGDASITGSTLKSDADTRIESASVEIASTPQKRAEIVASGGAIYIRSTAGSVTNRGALVEGKQASLSDPEASAAVTVLSARDVALSSLSLDQLGVFFGRSGDLKVEAAGSILNETARLFSNAAITLTAGVSISNATLLSGMGAEQRSVASGKRSWRTLWLKPEKFELFEALYGSPAIAGEQALVTAIGDVALTAPVIVNRGAQISGDKVTLSARERVKLESLATGAAHLTQRCGLISCWADGSSSTGLVPAAITAAKKIDISSQGTVTSTGARLVGTQGMTISAPSFSVAEVVLPFTVTRPSGLTGFFQGNYGWLSYNFDGGFCLFASGRHPYFDRRARRSWRARNLRGRWHRRRSRWNNDLASQRHAASAEAHEPLQGSGSLMRNAVIGSALIVGFAAQAAAQTVVDPAQQTLRSLERERVIENRGASHHRCTLGRSRG